MRRPTEPRRPFVPRLASTSFWGPEFSDAVALLGRRGGIFFYVRSTFATLGASARPAAGAEFEVKTVEVPVFRSGGTVLGPRYLRGRGGHRSRENSGGGRVAPTADRP